MRCAAAFVTMLLLSGCASQPQRPPGQVAIFSTAAGQLLPGASCSVETGGGRWTVQTPETINVGEPRGDLRVVCRREGYRISEVVIRRGTGGYRPGTSRVGVGFGSGVGYRSGVGFSLGFGLPLASSQARYPAQVEVEMTPIDSAQ